MAEASARPRYEEWLDFHFARFERDANDPWSMDRDFKALPTDIADLFIYTMENCGRDLLSFTDGQVATGLNALLFGSYGDVPYALTGAGPTEAQRIAALRSIKRLYTDCLARRAPPGPGRLSETQENPLEYIT